MKNIGDFKQELIKINNQVNEEMYGRGLDWQKIDIIGDKIIILALNRRISVLRHIDEKDAFTARLMDLALLNEFKIRIKTYFEDKFQLKVRTILKDYDPVNQLAGMIIITVEPVEEFFEKIFSKNA
ncbi:Na-translocating system protein MpsC family protein [Tepidanaerobacter sp. EBM-38]|uniref:Na-translocating system protein MpsC family protein n=1 Tax=Tepidanaerobacter sp. EBM-38 TaxID=1918496 RepID=UPI000AC091E0|nr:Na-translocating system protein MpsC family protein [Tepidanaerobacter sp. EBM-38]